MQQDAINHQDQVKPSFIVAVDLNKSIRYNRQVLLRHCWIRSWYLLDTGENRLKTADSKELLAKVQYISDLIGSGGISGIPASIAYLGGAMDNGSGGASIEHLNSDSGGASRGNPGCDLGG